MHLLIPCAGVLSLAGLQAQRALSLPTLARLLAGMIAAPRDEGDEYSRIPPHERALAKALGLWRDDAWPMAAWQATRDGIDPGTRPWGLLTPAHQHVGTEQVSLLNPELLALDEPASRALFETIRDLFESEGGALVWAAPLRWYLHHPQLEGLATASLDRVIGRNVDAWLPDHAPARLIRRLLMEVQMTLHAAPLNEAREAAGQLGVNTCWLSGCGALPAPGAPGAETPPTVVDTLREPALDEDWARWTRAWLSLDSGPLADLLASARRGEPASLTLCGERHAQRFDWQHPGLLQRWAARWRQPDIPVLLEGL